MAMMGLPKSSFFMPVARHRARAPAMLRPWVVVRERYWGMVVSIWVHEIGPITITKARRESTPPASSPYWLESFGSSGFFGCFLAQRLIKKYNTKMAKKPPTHKISMPSNTP